MLVDRTDTTKTPPGKSGATAMPAEPSWIRLPRHVIAGPGEIVQVPAVFDELGEPGPAVIVTTPTPRRVAADHVADQLRDDVNIDVSIIGVEGASGAAVEAAIEQATGASIMVGVGGGTAIDIAKLASDRLDVPFVSVPTAASHDGIVSGRASIPDGDTRHSVAADPPLAVIADTEIIADAPWELTTAGCADIISNYTAVKDWQLARRLRNVSYSEYAAALSEMTAEMLVADAARVRPGLADSAGVVVKALVSSGVAMSIAGSSRPASGAEHLVSHELDRLAPGVALHGHQVGVASIVTAYLQTGEEGDWQRIRDALAALDAPTTAAELGIEPDTFIEALTQAHLIRDRYTILGDGITERAARQAASVTGVVPSDQ